MVNLFPSIISQVKNILLLLLVTSLPVAILLGAGMSHADTNLPGDVKRILLKQVPSPSGSGYGYRLEYYVRAPIDVFWKFKTDFDSDILLTSNELLDHRLVRVDGDDVYTENRYASAPGLRFLWKTTVIDKKYRLDFELMNVEDCRHKFHHGYIQLSPAGRYTKVIQTAFFDFTGASFWVKYPWYGGMKYTLTSVAKWEQKVAVNRKQMSISASVDRYADEIHR
ncbi:MAG: hypothetical protein QNJ58_27745 [Desulfobacterales bacterium]|nr:hypothetical protein [Desulfobacterales bacterium]